ncbi:hypothetical protein LX32DRAFT_644681 [Colletotrichum zoysiae]|uniref:Uncharacterized protein n=1 Tax=Colletotrichum zoysiae TaxID=1216348 RepID=A0AAD9H707_9PEZI|nr:hypothetical protein LX32DRAFT_644681 [Colletotrichum zoysiae]
MEVVGLGCLGSSGAASTRGWSEQGQHSSVGGEFGWTGCHYDECIVHYGSKQRHGYLPKRKWNRAKTAENLIPFLNRRADQGDRLGPEGQTRLVLYQSEDPGCGIIEHLAIVFTADDAAEDLGGGLTVDCRQVVLDSVFFDCMVLAESTFYSMHLMPATHGRAADVTVFGRQYFVDHSE